MMKLNTDMPGFFCVYVFAFFSRWAQFFIHPLMIRDAIDREVEAVDSGKRCTLCLTIVFFIIEIVILHIYHSLSLGYFIFES